MTRQGELQLEEREWGKEIEEINHGLTWQIRESDQREIVAGSPFILAITGTIGKQQRQAAVGS